MSDQENVQEYDATVSEPVRVWVFCRECRCRLQVRCVPRPELPFACLCGQQGTLAEFSVFDREERAKEVSGAFEVGYQAAKEALSSMMTFKKTRMYSVPAEVGSLLDESSDGSDRYAPKPFETEAEYQEQIDGLLARLEGSQKDVLARHEALTEIVRFTFPRRQLRSAAKAYCVRACQADLQQLDALVRQVQQARKVGATVRLTIPAFRKLIQIHQEDGNIPAALAVAVRARASGMPGFEETIAELKAAR